MGGGGGGGWGRGIVLPARFEREGIYMYPRGKFLIPLLAVSFLFIAVLQFSCLVLYLTIGSPG